jgi:hypothetical protein
MFRLNRNKQTANRNSLILDSEHILVFCSGNLRLFWFVSKQYCSFQLFRFYTETHSFNVSIEPKQTEDQSKQVDREAILIFFRKFRVVSVCFETFLFVSVVSI